MCGKPKTVKQDPEGDAQRAAEKATAETNLKKAMRRTTGNTSTLGSKPESAKTTLGGG